MSLTDYLAKKYLTVDNSATHSSSKKRKRSHKISSLGLSIADDDSATWGSRLDRCIDSDDETGIVAGQTSEFRRVKNSKWMEIGAAPPSDREQASADAILTAAAIEESARVALDAEEQEPQIVHREGLNATERMSSGAKAGLQSASAVTAQMARQKAEERKQFEAYSGSSGKGQETIYRDASGRIVNVAMKRAEARKAVEEAERRKERQVEFLKGDVQKVDKSKREQDIKDAKFLPIARYANDVSLNEELKETDRWNDPAAQFLTNKKQRQSMTGKPVYKGSSVPNRYGIRPGYRWDGVDRSNGWEKQWFKKRNEQESMKNLRYQWETDE